MCGIAGGWWRNEPVGLEARLRDARNALVHRGPDDRGLVVHRGSEGTVALAHRRLSIIDLSAAGRQPMRSADGRYDIVLNGEIYNYKELREELKNQGRPFTTDTDTEVLLNAWAAWGEACLPRLTGMFAFVVYDGLKGALICARDAFGIKPFYYSLCPEAVAFASELPSLRLLVDSKGGVNLQRAYDYLVFGDYDHREESFFEGINQLMPGHILTMELSRKGTVPEVRRWYWPPVGENRDLSFQQAAEKARELFLKAVRLHMRSDVPLGAALSGGIDSSAIVCAMQRVEPDMPINTFSYVARGVPDDEEPWVDLVTRTTGAVSRKIVLSPSDLARDLDHMIRLQGEPFGGTSIYAQYGVFRLAAEHGIKVTLDGQGGDEMFAGYNGYPAARMGSMLDRRDLLSLAAFTYRWSKWPDRSLPLAGVYLGSVFVPRRLVPLALSLIGRHSKPDWINCDYLRERGVSIGPALPLDDRPVRGRRLAGEMRTALAVNGLTSLLRHADRNSMCFSMESRVPFLTTELADFVLSLPEDYHVSPRGETKRLLRAAMRGIVPDAILDRRDKIGFATPEKDWLMAMTPMIRSWIHTTGDIPFLDERKLSDAFEAVVEGRTAFTWQVWRWINFARWHELAF